MNIRKLIMGSQLVLALSLSAAPKVAEASPNIWYAATWGGLCGSSPVQAGGGVHKCVRQARLNFSGDAACPWGSAACNGATFSESSFQDIARLYYDPQGEVMVKYAARVGSALPPQSHAVAPYGGVLSTDPNWDFYYGHVQGFGRFQRNDAAWFVGSSSSFQTVGRAGFWVAKLNTAVTSDSLIAASDDGKNRGAAAAFYRLDNAVHPGGLQVLGKYVLVPRECTADSCAGQGGIEVWDLGDPLNGFRIKNISINSGATTLPGSPHRPSSVAATRMKDGRYLIVVAGRATSELWFYMTRRRDIASEWVMVHHQVMENAPETVKKKWKQYQNMSMFVDRNGRIYMMATAADGELINTLLQLKRSLGQANIPDNNRFHFYEVLPQAGLGVALKYVRTDPFRDEDFTYPINDECSAAGGAGAYVGPQGTMAIYCHSDIPSDGGEHKILQLSRGYTQN